MKRPRLAAAVLLLAVVAVWGATFPLVKSALHDCTPLFFNQIRMVLAFAVLAIVHAREWKRMTRHSLVTGAFAGLFLACGYEFQTAGLALTTPSKSAFLTGMIVVIVPLIGLIPGVTPGRKSLWLTLAAAVVAFAGIVLLTVPAGTRADDFYSTVNRGDLLTLACAIAFALHLITLSKASHGIPVAHLATLQIGFCALVMSLATPLLESVSVHWNLRLIAVLMVCAIFATAAAFSIQSWAQRHLPPAQTALILSLEPVFAYAVSLLLFGERLNARSLSGAGLIFAAILLAELGPSPVPADGAALPASDA